MKRLPLTHRVFFRSLARWLSRSRSGAGFLVLHYHRVSPVPDMLFPDNLDPGTFAAHLDVLADVFKVLPLSEALRRLDSASLPEGAICISFDDGYADNFEVALPLLRARGMPATFFIATGFTGGENMWNDTVIEGLRRAGQQLDLSAFGLGSFHLDSIQARRRAIDAILTAIKYRDPRARARLARDLYSAVSDEPVPRLMMSESQIRGLARSGMELGAHTVTHPILARMDAAAARNEIVKSKTDLEAIAGAPVDVFAYPNGKPGIDYDRSHVEIVRDTGFQAAFSTAWGCIARSTDRLQMPRVAPWDRSAARFAARLTTSYLSNRAQVA